MTEWIHLVPVILSYYTLIHQDFYKFLIVGVCAFTWPHAKKLWYTYWHNKQKQIIVHEFNEFGHQNMTYVHVVQHVSTNYVKQLKRIVNQVSIETVKPINGLETYRRNDFEGHVKIDFLGELINIWKPAPRHRKTMHGEIECSHLVIEALSYTIIDQFIDECQRSYIQHRDSILNNGKVTFEFQGKKWIQREISVNKTFDNVVLNPSDKSRLLNILKCFQSCEFRTYNDQHGMANKLGFLFYGAPGCGKSSTILAMSNFTKLPIYYVNCHSIELRSFRQTLYEIPNRVIVVFEDIDCWDAMRQRKQTRNQCNDNSFLKLMLEFLDGYISLENSLVIMTANFPERLDTALIRPGRIDFQFKFETSKTPMCEFMNQQRMAKLLSKNL